MDQSTEVLISYLLVALEWVPNIAHHGLVSVTLNFLFLVNKYELKMHLLLQFCQML